jgi:hypothetical protein
MAPENLAALNLDAHASVGSWLQEMRARGFTVPLALWRGLAQAMDRLSLSLPEAFHLLLEHRKVLVSECHLIYDLSAAELWERTGRDSAGR